MGDPSRDSVALDLTVSPIEVSARSPVAEPGIHPQSSGLLDVVDGRVTIPVPRSIRRSTALEPVPSTDAPTTPCATLMPSTRTSPPSVASPITVLSTRTTSSSRVVLWEPARDLLLSARPSSPAPRPGRPRSLTSSSSIPPPSTDMEDSRPMPRRTSSWASSPPRSRSPPRPPRTPQKPRETESEAELQTLRKERLYLYYFHFSKYIHHQKFWGFGE